MAYNDFAYWYDILNSQADYDALADELLRALGALGVSGGILADLGCGTGEATLRLANAGYDMIAIDSSPDMLSILRGKLGAGQDILLLCQDLAELDLFGTIRAAVSTFDTFNHLPRQKLEKLFARVSLFMEKGGAFLFDVNTPYKHTHILKNNTISIEAGEDGTIECVWQNCLQADLGQTEIRLDIFKNDKKILAESFYEYYYPLSFFEQILQKNGFKILEIKDGETFGPLLEHSQRALFISQKD